MGTKLLARLTLYYAAIALVVFLAVQIWPEFRNYLPVGGVEQLITQPSKNPLQGDAIHA